MNERSSGKIESTLRFDYRVRKINETGIKIYPLIGTREFEGWILKTVFVEGLAKNPRSVFYDD